MVKVARITAWMLVAALVFVTMAPIGLRPIVADSANLERATAYAFLGLVFALAYPRHRLLALLVVVTLAGVLEFGQTLTASRHGRIPDFLVKASSAAAGVLGAHAALLLRDRAERRAAGHG